MIKDIKVICTIGPSTFYKKKLEELKRLKVNLFRINLSHTKVTDLPKRIKELKNLKIRDICIDVEGAQVRTTTLKKKFLKNNQTIIFNKKLKNNTKNIGLYPDFNFNKLKKNDHIFIGFENLKLKVSKVKKDIIKTKVINEGYVDSNKGVHFNRNIKLKALTQKDIDSITIAKSLNVKNFALSFANNKKDVLEFRKLIGKNSNLISKIETKQALKNLNEIISHSNEILIDRGDLSRYVPIEKIPIAQMHILKKSIFKKTKCFVATNLLETMVVNKEPTRAESNDIFSTLDKGADGLVLAAETAVGKYPIECVKFIKKCIQSYKLYQKNLKSNKKAFI